jgi:hypothetical protein
MADGRDNVEIAAYIRNSNGGYVPNGTNATFTTNIGTFDKGGTSLSVGVQSGRATARLRSQQKGTALVQIAVPGGGFQKLEITFTDDPSETFEGNTFISIYSSKSLIYSAADRVVHAKARTRGEADEKELGGAVLQYRQFSVFADEMQLDAATNSVRALGNIQLRRGGHRLLCEQLFLNLNNGEGYAVADLKGRLQPVSFKGANLNLEPLETGVAPRFFQMVDLTEAKLVIAANHIVVFPGEKLQFKRPKFYQDGLQLMEMPFYSLGLYSTQLFTDQFLSVGSQGIGVDYPWYFDMTPGTTGQFRARYGERSGRSVFATRQGFSLDFSQAYNSLGSNKRYMGEFNISGMTRSDWGARWNHNQEFAGNARGSFTLDFPQHRALFASSNLSKQFDGFSTGLNFSANRSVAGFKTQGVDADAYIETNPRNVGRTGYMMALGATTAIGETHAGDVKFRNFTRGIQSRFFSRPVNLDRQTQVTNYFTIGQMWASNGQSGQAVTASLTATRALRQNANLTLTYDYTKTPGFAQFGGNHRLSLSMSAMAGQKWSLFLYNTLMLDASNASFTGDLSYFLSNRWRLSFVANIQRFSTVNYRDFEMGVAHNIGGREVVVSWSTFNRRLFFDIEASRF